MGFFIFLCAIALILTVYIGYRAFMSEQRLFSISNPALFAGLLFESYQITKSWKNIGGIFVGSYLLSLFSFIPGGNNGANAFESQVAIWPYVFLFIYATLFGIGYKEKVTAKLTEGITLLLTISIIYWIFDYGFTNNLNWFSISVMAIVSLLSLISVVHSLTMIELTRRTRLTLSVWSSIILFAFALDNIFRVFNNPSIESSNLSQALSISLQYFLLGVSVVYIVQNYMLLAAFLPSKNSNYKKDLKEGKNEHIKRFSNKQVNIKQSLFCIVFTMIVYWLNYTYQFLPRHTMVWLVFFTFPFIINAVITLNGKIR